MHLQQQQQLALMSQGKRAANRKPLQLQQCRKVIHNAIKSDPFSRLSDDIIVSHILPRLPVEERVRTSLLSRRWKKLWTQSVGDKLIFSKTYAPFKGPCKDVVRNKGHVLARGISHVLESYLKPTLDELTVCFDFDSSSSDIIDSWVVYALRKRATQLGLNFLPAKPCASKDNYTFPGMDKLLAWHVMSDDHLHQPINCGLYHLRDVCLKFVNVSVEIIEFMLCNCPSLERLCVWNSSLRQKIRVSKQSSKLKSLEFVDCGYTKIKISPPYLVSLKYKGYGRLHLENIPLLSELSLGSQYCRKFLKRPARSSINVSQLTKLALDINHMAITESITFSLEFPKLVKLKQLEMRFNSCENSSLLWPIILLKAAPILEKVSIKLGTVGGLEYSKPGHVDFRSNILVAIEHIHHRSLKVIEIQDFQGYPLEFEFCQHLLGISEALEKFVVSTTESKRKDVLVFKKWLPPTAKLVVLKYFA